jgi:Tfp pilus assembly pilus retraction ATPase PilT
MIRENKVHQIEAYLMSPENEASGMLSLDSCLRRLLREGLILLEDSLKIASDREQLQHIAKAAAEES